MIEWAPFAQRLDGPWAKQGYPGISHSDKRGEIKHSAVGSWSGMLDVLTNHPVNSWHFSVLKDGRVLQHYSIVACCYHGNDTDPDGGVRANLDLIGIEHEGGPPGNESEPLTIQQILATVQVTRWCAEQFDFDNFGRYPFQENVWTMAEHNQVGNSPTACPSGRIPWDIIETMLEEEEVSSQQQRIDALAKAIIQVNNGWNLKDLGSEIAAILQEIAQEASNG